MVAQLVVGWASCPSRTPLTVMVPDAIREKIEFPIDFVLISFIFNNKNSIHKKGRGSMKIILKKIEAGDPFSRPGALQQHKSTIQSQRRKSNEINEIVF